MKESASRGGRKWGRRKENGNSRRRVVDDSLPGDLSGDVARSKIGRLDGNVLSSNVVLKRTKRKEKGCKETIRSGGKHKRKGDATNLVGTEHVLVEDVHSDLDESRVSNPTVGMIVDRARSASFEEKKREDEEAELTFHRVQRRPLESYQL